MAEFEVRPKMALELVIRMNETEVRYLYALARYDHQVVADALNTLGTSYTREYLGGLFSILKSALEFGPAIERTDNARKVFIGTHDAVPKDRVQPGD